MLVAKNTVVSLHYKMKNASGQLLDSTDSRGPLVYLHGIDPLLPGLQKALESKGKGDLVNVTLEPADAFGVRDERLVQSVPRSAFQSAEVKVGSQFQSSSQQGPVVYTVVKIEGDTVTVDGNHGLAGQAVQFEVNIQDVRAATPDELAHGHVHGPGGHHHH